MRKQNYCGAPDQVSYDLTRSPAFFRPENFLAHATASICLNFSSNQSLKNNLMRKQKFCEAPGQVYYELTRSPAFFWPEIFLAHATALICLESFLTSEFKKEVNAKTKILRGSGSGLL